MLCLEDALFGRLVTNLLITCFCWLFCAQFIKYLNVFPTWKMTILKHGKQNHATRYSNTSFTVLRFWTIDIFTHLLQRNMYLVIFCFLFNIFFLLTTPIIHTFDTYIRKYNLIYRFWVAMFNVWSCLMRWADISLCALSTLSCLMYLYFFIT